MKLIKIYGERNTNTNYLSKLIELNLQAQEIQGVVPPYIMKIQELLPGNEFIRDLYFHFTFPQNLGWKHTAVKPTHKLERYKLYNDNLTFLTITKNPYSWLLSLYRNPYHQYYDEKPSFEVFLQTEWKTIARDGVQGNLVNPIELWNIKNRSYLQLDQSKALNITTESIFNNASHIIKNISKQFSIERKDTSFINYERSTKNNTKDSNYYRDYYLLEKWKEELTPEAIKIINNSLDKELAQSFGYKILN